MVDIEKRQEEFERIYDKLNWNFLPLYDDSLLDQAMNNSMLLETFPDQMVEVYNWTLERILYSRYYWFTKFLVRYEEKYGKDGSMEQAQFKIIEEMDYIGAVDSACLEHIEQELGYED